MAKIKITLIKSTNGRLEKQKKNVEKKLQLKEKVKPLKLKETKLPMAIINGVSHTLAKTIKIQTKLLMNLKKPNNVILMPLTAATL